MAAIQYLCFLGGDVTFQLKPPVADRLINVEFDHSEFAGVIESKGMRVLWQSANECPCFEAGSEVVAQTSPLLSSWGGDPNPGSNVVVSRGAVGCPSCNGTGYQYHSAQEIRALMTRGSSTTEYQREYGRHTRAEAYFTMRHQHLPASFDRLTLINQRHVFNEVVNRAQGVVTKLRYPIAPRVVQLEAGPTVVDVLHLHKVDPATGQALPSGVLVRGADFEVDGDGNIDWSLGDVLGTSPGEGDRFSVRYYCAPRYIVVEQPHTTRDTWVEFDCPDGPHFQPMPVQCKAVVEHLYYERA